MTRKPWLLLGALAFLLPLGACPGSPDAPDAAGLPDAGPVTAVCSHTCPRCKSDEVCFPGLGGFVDHAAACLKRCTSRSDCGAGQRCASIYGELIPATVCVALDNPPPCGTGPVDPSWHCDFPPGTCKDDKTLFRPYSQPENRVCGSELVTCPTRCDTVDAGTFATGECH